MSFHPQHQANFFLFVLDHASYWLLKVSLKHLFMYLSYVIVKANSIPLAYLRDMKTIIKHKHYIY
jgi:hypothetical protein